MNSSTTPSPAVQWIKRLALPLTILALICLVVAGVTSFFRLSGDARCLRNCLTSAAEGQSLRWTRTVELNVGPFSFAAVRAALGLVPLRPEVRAGLQALRGAEVGYYRFADGAGEFDHVARLAAADAAMGRRGWDRIVGVTKADDLIAVYAPRKASAGGKVRACVAVLNQKQLVVVGTRTDLEPLVNLAMSRPEWKQERWLASRF